MPPELLIFANSAGLSVPLTVLTLAGLHHFRAGPALVDVLARRHPWAFSTPVLVAAAVLVLFEILASKSKLSKPIRHLYDAVQTLVKPATAVFIALAMSESRDPQSIHTYAAQTFPGPALASLIPHVGFYVGVAIAVSLLVHSVRTMADLLAWLSPIPLIDAVVSAIADTYALTMIGLVVFVPKVALAVCVIQLVLCAALVRPLNRVAAVAFRMLAGWLRQLRTDPPVPPRWVAELAAPAVPTAVWVEKASMFRRYEMAYVYLDSRELHLVTRRLFGQVQQKFELPPAGWAALSTSLLAFRIVLHARQSQSPILAIGLARDQEQDARALIEALRNVGLAVDDATGLGERLPASWRARATS